MRRRAGYRLRLTGNFIEAMDTALASAEPLGELDVETTHCFHGGTVAAGSERTAEIATMP
jgi:hypothetical protein